VVETIKKKRINNKNLIFD